MSSTTSHTVPGAATKAREAAAPDALGFTDQRHEITLDALPIEGEFPAWLTGSLLRNGPARWDLQDGAVNHWFDGMAMLHRFAFGDGKVGYRNRLLRGKAGKAYEATGKVAYAEFATDPCRTTFQRIASGFMPKLTDNGAVTLHRTGDRWLAMTETPLAVVFDPTTLDSLGVERTAPGLRFPVAHAHPDPQTGELVFLRVHMGPSPKYEITARAPSGDERTIATVKCSRPGYQHSFGITDRFAVISESPFVVNPLKLAIGGKPFIENYQWKPEQGSKFWAIDRQSGEVHGPWTAPAFFTFHHVNTVLDGDTLVVDLLAYDDAQVVKQLALPNLRQGGMVAGAALVRFHLPPGGGKATVQPLQSDHTVELPRIDDRRTGRPYRAIYAVGAGDGLFDRLVKFDLASGAAVEWSEPGTYPGEPIFVARPEGTEEDDGVVLSVVLEPARGTSSLVVLDAASFTEIARARVPQHIPLGFHGAYARGV